MDRAGYIEQIAARETQHDIRNIVNALVRCLHPSEAADLLLRTAKTSTVARASAVRKVRSDILENRLGDPITLVESLVSQVREVERRRRESVAYCLLEIASVCDSSLKCRVQSFFGSSRYVGLRRRSYKLYDADVDQSRILLEHSWREYGDHEAAWSIIKTFPPSFLLSERTALAGSFTEGWQLSRLYLRIADQAPELLNELLQHDSISYLYVAAKQRIAIADDIVDGIVRQHLGDERVGLMLWSLGELGLWDVLQRLAEDVEAIECAQRARARGDDRAPHSANACTDVD